jgi:hypothetical protein
MPEIPSTRLSRACSGCLVVGECCVLYPAVDDLSESVDPSWPPNGMGGVVQDGAVVVGVLTHRDPLGVQRLIARILEGRRTVVVVHHDPRGPTLRLPTDERVLRVPDAAPANWGGMGVAEAQMRLIRFAVDRIPDFSWVMIVSGQDYPVRHLRSIENELRETSADAFVRHLQVGGDPADDVHPWQALTRRRYLRRRVLPRTHRSIPWPRRHPFGDDTSLWVGDLWVNLSARAARHVLYQYGNRPDLVRYFATTSIPDEALLPTLLMNDSPGLTVIPNHRRHIEWSNGGAHPDLLTIDHLNALATSSAFFARRSAFEGWVMVGRGSRARRRGSAILSDV